MSRRPYSLHAGDEVVVRAPVRDEQIGAVRNGTRAVVVDVDAEREWARLRLSDGREASWGREQIDAGQVRLAYVQHPFPAQGITTDTSHVIAGPLSTAEGSYVGLTRARETTRVYAASDQLDLERDGGREQAARALGERLGRSEPEMASIRVPLAHERQVEREHEQQTLGLGVKRGRDELAVVRAERDRLAAVLESYPDEQARRVESLQARVEDARLDRDGARERAEHARLQFEQLGRRDRRNYGPQLVEQVRREDLRAELAEQAIEETRQEIAAIRQGPEDPAVWEAEHPNAREHLKQAEQKLDQALDRHAERAIQTPGEHLTRVLGQRPGPEQAVEREAWDNAGHAVERYRAEHQIDPAEPSTLGAEPRRGDSGVDQRLDWRNAAERVIQAREELGIARQGMGTVEERLARVEGIAPDRDLERQRDRGLGRGM